MKMKTKYRNILVLFLAATVFFVGAGVTVVNLCCSGCVDKLISMNLHSDDCSMVPLETETPSCCGHEDSHSMDKSEDGKSCASDHTGKCCETKRVSVDIDRSVYQPNLLQSMVWVVALPSFISNLFEVSDTSDLLASAEARDPIPIPPRNYLSLIRVLII